MRFDVGQPVIVNNVIASKHSGKRAVIVEYRPTRKGTDTLDKYVVEICTANGWNCGRYNWRLVYSNPIRAGFAARFVIVQLQTCAIFCVFGTTFYVFLK
jgi:hypothetical protein